MSQHPSLFVALRYRDPERAIRFMKEALAFEEHVVYRDAAGAIQHAELRFGNGMVMLGGAHCDDAADAEPAAAATAFSVYAVVADPDGHHARAVAHGAEVVYAPRDTEYGSREHGVRDPEGVAWSFGTYQPFAVPPGGP
ncbi:MAG: VOC family protein [Myxococcales bacterium]|nr:VOC family protein [Myxococcales bacterium]MCB9733824.1 VOC family protein [Deltaproteobacteria bacterium]